MSVLKNWGSVFQIEQTFLLPKPTQIQLLNEVLGIVHSTCFDWVPSSPYREKSVMTESSSNVSQNRIRCITSLLLFLGWLLIRCFGPNFSISLFSEMMKVLNQSIAVHYSKDLVIKVMWVRLWRLVSGASWVAELQTLKRKTNKQKCFDIWSSTFN